MIISLPEDFLVSVVYGNIVSNEENREININKNFVVKEDFKNNIFHIIDDEYVNSSISST